MAKKAMVIDGYKALTAALKANQILSLYYFHGEERYLLERGLLQIRERLCPDGISSFNYRRYEGRDISLAVLDDAINTLPAFAERTLIVVHDYDIFKSEDKPRLIKILADLPEYVCLIFVFDTVVYKPDGRRKDDKELQKHAQVLEFPLQQQAALIGWIKRHFKDADKEISTSDAEYLALLTGGLMTALIGEIGKVAAYTSETAVRRSDIDAVVIPTLDTAAYKVSDALVRRDHMEAMRLLDELFRMREAPHRIFFSIALKMRQLLAARICIESNSGVNAFMKMCGIWQEYHARPIMSTAQKSSLKQCRDAVLMCSDTAYALNSSSDPEASLVELIVRLGTRE